MKNQLSALIDGELELSSAEHLLTSIKSGGELKDTWKSYHLIGDVMRGNNNMPTDFTSRVMQALENEPTILVVGKFAASNNEIVNTEVNAIEKQNVSKGVFKNSWFTNTKVLSIAASVAAVMFVGLMLLQQQFSGNNLLAPVEIAKAMPLEYLEAHQSAAPNGAAYYIQPANFDPQQ